MFESALLASGNGRPAAALDPGAERAVAAALRAFDEGSAGADDLIDALQASARLIAWAQARQVELIAEIVRREPPIQAAAGLSPVEPAVLEVGVALNWSPATARTRVHEAVDLVTDRSATLAALREGRIDWPRVRAILEALVPLQSAAAVLVEAQALQRASRQTPAQLRSFLRREVARHDARGADERHRSAVEDRRVVFTPLSDGMTELWALLPADAAVELEAHLNSAANRRAAGDGRSADQRRADALADLVAAGTSMRGPAADGIGPSLGAKSRRPEVALTVPLGTLLGLGDEPAYLAGYGPIPDVLARRLAADGIWRRILTDPASGTVLDVGRTRYEPPTGLDDFVRTRDGTCRFPGCRRRASACDLDHTVPFPAGGTSAANLHALCRAHHRLKHESEWEVRVDGEPNRLVWTSPAARQYATTAPEAGGESEFQQVGRTVGSDRSLIRWP